MKTLKIIFLIIISSVIVQAQVETLEKITLKRLKYNQDFFSFMGENGKTRLDVFIQVPYQEVNFIKTGEGFEASYTITVSVYDEEKESIITEKIWNEKIIARSFDETTAERNFNLGYRSFQLLPGKYFIRSSIMDKESRDEIFSENYFMVKDLSSKPVISDIMFISDRAKVGGENRIIPNVTGDITAEKDGIPLFFEVYSDSISSVQFEYIVMYLDNEIAFTDTQSKTLEPGSNQLFYTIDKLTLNLGRYIISVSMKDELGKEISISTKQFISRWAGVPNSIKDLDKAVDQLVYIANPDELDKIEESETNEMKTKRFIEFWKKRDPNPNNEYNQAFEEYYRRVLYADENFSTYSEGWRSDRGMVLIILGLPDNIDRHPFEYDSKPYEVWQYYELNRSFVFVDNTGFGDYRLVTPLYGDLFRFRY